MATSPASGPKIIERVEVVPWSTTRTCPVMKAILAQMPSYVATDSGCLSRRCDRNASPRSTWLRAIGPPSPTRTASGGAPFAAKASLGTTPRPLDRAWVTKTDRVQPLRIGSQMLKLSGSERYAPGSKAFAAMRSRAMLSDRMNLRIVSAVPSLIHRVATAAEIGDAITQSARIALLNDHAAGGSGATT